MIIVLNGPLGIGKSTLAEALTESIEYCAMLDGDRLVAVNPPPAQERALEHLRSTIELLITHHRRFGYRHFVVDHVWRSPAELADLRRRLTAIDGNGEIRCFLLTLPADENLRRIERRQRARAIDEREFELRTFEEERQVLTKGSDLGEPFDVSAPPPELVARMLRRLEIGVMHSMSRTDQE
jgi:chloramphenicol 3-O-phosphotransferase